MHTNTLYIKNGKKLSRNQESASLTIHLTKTNPEIIFHQFAVSHCWISHCEVNVCMINVWQVNVSSDKLWFFCFFFLFGKSMSCTVFRGYKNTQWFRFNFEEWFCFVKFLNLSPVLPKGICFYYLSVSANFIQVSANNEFSQKGLWFVYSLLQRNQN